MWAARLSTGMWWWCLSGANERILEEASWTVIHEMTSPCLLGPLTLDHPYHNFRLPLNNQDSHAFSTFSMEMSDCLRGLTETFHIDQSAPPSKHFYRYLRIGAVPRSASQFGDHRGCQHAYHFEVYGQVKKTCEDEEISLLPLSPDDIITL